MRRLLTWTLILICCASVTLIGIRMLYPDPSSASCVQLLTPATGDVLTVDTNTGVALLDARDEYPLPLPNVTSSFGTALSPDHTHVIDLVQKPGTQTYYSRFGNRSTANRHAIPFTFDRFLWSPDSQHIAFHEGRRANGHLLLDSLTIADINKLGMVIKQESIKNNMEYDWLITTSYQKMAWSPDSSLIAVALFTTNVGATLVLRSIDSDQSIYVPIPDQRIYHITWSPRSQTILVFTQSISTPTKTILVVIDRSGHILQQIPFTSNLIFPPDPNLSQVPAWAADGQYFYLMWDTLNKRQVDIFAIDGKRVLPTPLESAQAPVLWSTQPHTLLYMVDQPATRTLYAVDIVSGQTTPLIENIPPNQLLQLAPDQTALAVVTSTVPDKATLRLLTLDLQHNTAPFGEMDNGSFSAPQWSPDSQNVLMTSKDKSEFALKWVQKDSAVGKTIPLPQQLAKDASWYASWQSPDIVLIQNFDNERRIWWLVDTNTEHLLPLAEYPANEEFYIASNDNGYLTISTASELTLYRLRDGQPLLSSDQMYGIYEATSFVAPDERALLLIYDGLGDGEHEVNLFTSASHQTITSFYNGTDIALPAWSPAGEMFAFAQLADFNDNWSLSIMTRDGTLLHSFPIPPRVPSAAYQYVRWTDCQ